MFDPYKRKINYLRISVTDRCNLRCRYCMPEHGIKWIGHENIISYEEIVEVVKEAVKMGINKFRITGGEPLVRKGIIQLIKMLSIIDGVEELTLTTNGILLEKYAQELKEAGLTRVNVSLDTLDPIKFKDLTRGGSLESVLKGIQAALEAGITPVKINCVVNNNDRTDADAVMAFGAKHNIQVRLIHQMNLANGTFAIVEGGTGGDCSQCNRLRLTSNAKIKPCLFNDQEYDIRKLGIRQALEMAIENKPEKGTQNHNNNFNNIGG